MLTPALAATLTSCSNNASSEFTIEIIKPEIQLDETYALSEKYKFEGFKVKSSLPGLNPKVTWTTDNSCASIDENGTLTFIPNQIGIIKIKITATCNGYKDISATLELEFKVVNKKGEVLKTFEGKYFGSNTGSFILKFKKDN